MWPLLGKYQIPQPVVQDDSRHSHQNPQQAVRQADLSQDIARHSAVVPYMPPQRQVDNATGQELQGCDNPGPDQRLLPQWHTPWYQLIDQADQDETKAAQTKHCPVRPTAPNQLHTYVQPSSDHPQDNTLKMLPHSHHLPLRLPQSWPDNPSTLRTDTLRAHPRHNKSPAGHLYQLQPGSTC